MPDETIPVEIQVSIQLEPSPRRVELKFQNPQQAEAYYESISTEGAAGYKPLSDVRGQVVYIDLPSTITKLEASVRAGRGGIVFCFEDAAAANQWKDGLWGWENAGSSGEKLYVKRFWNRATLERGLGMTTVSGNSHSDVNAGDVVNTAQPSGGVRKKLLNKFGLGG